MNIVEIRRNADGIAAEMNQMRDWLDAHRIEPLLFQLNEGQIFVARRNPELGERTHGDVYMERGNRIEIPSSSDLVKNITVTALEKFLGAVIGISENENRGVRLSC